MTGPVDRSALPATAAAIVFDLDGTLVDSVPDIHAAVNRTLADEGAGPMPLAQVCGFVGNGVPILLQRVAAAREEPADAARQADRYRRFMGHYDADPVTLTRLFPGVDDALAALRDMGHVLVLCTNKPEAISRKVLAALDIARHFADVIGGDTLALRKPDPAPLHAAIAIAGCGRAVFVGDSEVDAETAAAADVPFLLFTEGYRKQPIGQLRHSASFSRFSDLPARVAETLGKPVRIGGARR